MSVTERLGGFLLAKSSRRSFIAKSAMTATALSVAPVDFLLHPVSAYASVCSCADSNCDCSSLCCDGYTQFCCTINNGVNACPVGTFAGGWWKADGSAYCSGPRYYIDCMGECNGCGCGSGNFCPGCDDLVCECALGSCGNRHVGCTEFRYGQCHQEIVCSGRISCRVVSCTPPWVLDSTCSMVAQTDDATANHFAPCQNGPTEEEDMPLTTEDKQWIQTYVTSAIVAAIGMLQYGDSEAAAEGEKPQGHPFNLYNMTQTLNEIQAGIGMLQYGDSEAAAEGQKPQGHPFNLYNMTQTLNTIKGQTQP